MYYSTDALLNILRSLNAALKFGCDKSKHAIIKKKLNLVFEIILRRGLNLASEIGDITILGQRIRDSINKQSVHYKELIEKSKPKELPVFPSARRITHQPDKIGCPCKSCTTKQIRKKTDSSIKYFLLIWTVKLNGNYFSNYCRGARTKSHWFSYCGEIVFSFFFSI